ncbi:MAG: hypothetical protein GX926_01885 [Candidatus Magasanikbacteria bacterium]|nr:hypothetical protein [Candidatus Magasanikbacteria bacterium]
MKCHFEGIYDWEIIRETWDKRKSYPTNRCPKCGKPQFVPLDIYNEKKKSP